MKRRLIATAALVSVLLWVATAQAASDEQRCLAGRAKAQGKFEFCVQKWLSKGYGGGGYDQTKVSKCLERYAAAWTKLQLLTGSVTCSLTRFVDNGTTVTDNLTGLIWEKKTTLVGSGTDFGGDAGDVDNYYSWTDGDADQTDEDGDVFTDFLTNLNAGGGFASANGWRLPTFVELQTILLPEPFPCTTNPCIDPMFGPTQSAAYWSSTAYQELPQRAWVVSFINGGGVGPNDKPLGNYVRAVRGGL